MCMNKLPRVVTWRWDSNPWPLDRDSNALTNTCTSTPPHYHATEVTCRVYELHFYGVPHSGAILRCIITQSGVFLKASCATLKGGMCIIINIVILLNTITGASKNNVSKRRQHQGLCHLWPPYKHLLEMRSPCKRFLLE